MKDRRQQWLKPPIEQFTYTGISQVELFKGSSIPHTSALIKSAVTKDIFIEDDDSEASFYGEDNLNTYASTETELKEIEPAQYRFQCPKVFYVMRNDGASLALMEWIVENFKALEFDSMFRLLGPRRFHKPHDRSTSFFASEEERLLQKMNAKDLDPTYLVQGFLKAARDAKVEATVVYFTPENNARGAAEIATNRGQAAVDRALAVLDRHGIKKAAMALHSTCGANILAKMTCERPKAPWEELSPEQQNDHVATAVLVAHALAASPSDVETGIPASGLIV